MKMIVPSVLVLFMGLNAPTAAKDFSLIDTSAVSTKFENSMALAKETLRRYPAPRYMIYKVVVTFSLATGLDGSVEGKIPVGFVSVGFKGDYEQVTTKKQTFTYVPNTTIPTNVEDFGVLAFINQIQEKISTDLKKNPFIVTRAEHEEEFVVGIDGQGKLSFFNVADISGKASLKNTHKITFHFCLLGNDGKCVETS
jgi:hypothetical protein